MKSHDRIYSLAQIYDIAFDFKNIPEECRFLRSVFESFSGRRPQSFIDLAAGPALHAVEMARAGLSSAALDLSQEMVDYGLEKACEHDVSVDYRAGDFASFTWDRQFDLAGTFMDSTSYLLSNDAVVSHLRSVAQILVSDGIYILEMSHPRDVFSVGKSTQSSWESERGETRVSITWGGPDDPFDPITQVTQTTVDLKFSTRLIKQFTETASQRCFAVNELDALVRLEGSFEWITTFGAMDQSTPFNNEKRAWRMVPVLRKRRK
jgi:SAM-dependent methyltransferase